MNLRQIPSGFEFWPAREQVCAPEEIVRLYEAGFAGAWHDPVAREQFRDSIKASGGYAQAAEVVANCHLADVGKDGLWLLFPAIERLFPASLPGPAQQRGDCVVHCSKNAALASLCSEIESLRPDEETGKLEGPPEVSAAGVQNGVLSTEYLYWWRGHDGDGWDCASAAEMIRQHGLLVRQAYPQFDLDLTNYDARLAGKYGSRRPPSTIAEEGRLHLVRTATECARFEEVRDLIAVGCGIATCGSEGFSSERDDHGVSNRRGGWSHAMAYLGVDDRPETRRLYNGPLVLVCNSWGIWNRGPRLIRGTNLSIPHGCFWARWSDVSRRTAIAYSSLAGWPRQPLQNYGLSVLG